jgi:hypothetical protein
LTDQIEHVAVVQSSASRIIVPKVDGNKEIAGRDSNLDIPVILKIQARVGFLIQVCHIKISYAIPGLMNFLSATSLLYAKKTHEVIVE